jgi:hypothetical protein
MQRYIPLARARARRLDLIEFLPTTTAPFTATMQAASLFLLASAPFAAADIVAGGGGNVDGSRKYASQGACMDATTGIVACHAAGSSSASPLINTTCLDAGNTWFERAHVHTDGCCLCDSNCDHSKETAAAGTCNYADASAGSCKNAVTGKVTCDVVASQCASPNVWSAPGALDSDGCCFCDETCDHSAETGTNCHKGPYADESESSGSCYDMFGGHSIECDIGQKRCAEKGDYFYWYSPGYVGSSGCCHCDASCDHSLETGTCTNASYYGPGHGNEYTFAPTSKPVAIDAATSTTVGVLAAAAAAAALL